MTEEEMISVLDPDQTDEAKKKDLIRELGGLESPPSEQVIQTLMRVIRKPTIPEASERVYDDALEYLKSINRY